MAAAKNNESVSLEQLRDLRDDLGGRMSELKADWQRESGHLRADFHQLAAEIKGMVGTHAIEHKTDQVSLEKRVSDQKGELATFKAETAVELEKIRGQLSFWNRVWGAVSTFLLSLLLWLITGGRK